MNDMTEPASHAPVAVNSEGVVARFGRRMVRFFRWGTGDEQALLDEDFRRARRNLVWASAAAALLAVADFGAKNEAKSPLIAVTLPAGALVLAAAVYIMYLLWGYWFEAWRIHQANSGANAGHGNISADLKHKVERATDAAHGALMELAQQVRSHDESVATFDQLHKRYTTLCKVVGGVINDLAKAGVAVASEDTAHPAVQDLYGAVHGAEMKLRGKPEEFPFSRLPLPLPFRNNDGYVEGIIGRADKIAEQQTAFTRRAEELLALSDSLHGRARRHTIIYTLALPMVFGVAALVIPFFTQWGAIRALF